ncbi:MFS transporter [Ornithinicoccus hortensis]|uniref:Putative MFS family arabinose efflux permease n=1 Tax=Ornithinicoccus hortensis TaxID=82346 RepID=A0A542YSY0_9MICO|nr:MFS transporter [Ornithinicoccus hortensis]TQL51190.1 putative MFS family arabinose efflux permease [Ornithinicoccus hortensis]
MPRSAPPSEAVSPSGSQPTGRKQPSTALVITVLALCGTLVSLQQTLVLPLLPDFPEILNTSSDNASWLVTVTLLTAAVGTPIVSRLADMFGKRLMMVVCLVTVILGSLIAALSPSLPLVLTGRGLTGFGACLVPVGISIMRDHLPAERVGSGVALMSATLGIGGAVGMPLAGVIYEGLDWHALFWVSGAFAVLMLALVVWVVPESTVRTRGRFDYLGAVLLSAALSSLLLAISKAGSWGWTSERTIVLLVLAVLILSAWVPWELRSGQPLVDIRTSTRRTVLLTNAASILIGFAMFTNFLTSAQQVQMPAATGYGFGLSVVETGLAMLPGGILMVAMSPVAAWLIRRFGAREMLMAGALVIGVGFVLRVFLHSRLLDVLVASAVGSLGTALAFAAMPILIMRSVPITETASANGLNTLLRSIGTSTASATVAAVFAASVIDVEGAPVPSIEGYQLVFWLGTAAALGGATIAAFIRRHVPVAAREAQPADERVSVERAEVKPEGTEHELIVRGLVTGRSDKPIKQAVVTVLHPDGRHIDWGRTDNHGAFALALPGSGRYLVVASADGWAPQSGLVDLGEEEIEPIRMVRRLTLTGLVTDDGVPLPGVMLSLIRHSGEYVATAHADDEGRYEIGLPPPGRYVLTVVEPVNTRTRSRAVQVGSTSSTLDIDLLTGVPPHPERAAL